MTTCAFVSERHGIACQLTPSQHRAWGCHMAWEKGGIPILKSPGEFIAASMDSRRES